MPKSVRGMTYVLIIVDHFSKWVEVIALDDIKAPKLARAIYDNWICRYGVMQRLHSDGANNVHGEVMKQLSKLLGTDKSKSSRLHPEGDGISEAFVKIVKAVLRKHVEKYGENWDLNLQSAAYAIRSSINSGTGVTPAELVLGQVLHHPSDFNNVELGEKLPLNVSQARNFAKKLTKQVHESTAIVNDVLRKNRDQMKKTYDKNVTKHNFQVGDMVMIWDPPSKKGLSRAFQAKWNGPWKITRFIGSTNCRLENDRGKDKYTHLNLLKKVNLRNPLYTNANICQTPTNDLLDVNYRVPAPPAELVDPMLFESVDDSENEEQGPRFPIDNAYVDVAESNIIEQRLRSRTS